jgi:hypothetical protein
VKEGKGTYNTMANRKRTKGQIMIYKALHRKQKIEQHDTLLNGGDELRLCGWLSSSWSTISIHCVTLVASSMISNYWAPEWMMIYYPG